MFNLGLRKFYLVLLVTYCFLGQFTDALRCYQCKYGNNVLCSKNDVITVTCPTANTQAGASNSVTTCGYAQIIAKVSGIFDDLLASTSSLETLTWRGCVNSGVTTPETRFSYTFLTGTLTANTEGITAAAYSACSTSSDLCNKPRSCYRCSYGWNAACNSFDTVLDECYELSKVYCSSLIVTSTSYSCSSGTCYWKGCLSSSDVSTISSGISTVSNLDNAVASTLGQKIGITATGFQSIISTTLSYCSTDGCNGASQLYSLFNLSVLIATLLVHSIF